MTRQETLCGLIYMTFQFIFLPSLLYAVNDLLKHPMTEAELNFLYYFINFIAMAVLFHDFLGTSAAYAWNHPSQFIQAVILGFVAYYACSTVTNWAVGLLVPGFSNYNDASVAAMFKSSPFLMLVGTVILVPPVEECLYRGLIFRNLYGKSPWAAYIVSILAFSVIHILGYIGQYSALELVMAFLQYLPAGLCLAWAYTKSDTVFTPIIIHAAINYVSINGLR